MSRNSILFCLGFCAFSFSIANSSACQEVFQIAPLPRYSPNYYMELTLPEIEARNTKPNYIDISGNPYFTNGYKTSTMYLGGPRRISEVPAKLDMVTQQITFVTSNNDEITVPVGYVKEMDIFDSTSSGSRTTTVRIGYPPIDNQNQFNFYEVLIDGKVTMLKSLKKKIVDNKNEVSGDISKSFESDENYYFYVHGEMKRLRRDKSYILGLFPGDNLKLEDYARASNINFRSYEQVLKLVTYYNSLQ